jgi:hypothetical protein
MPYFLDPNKTIKHLKNIENAEKKARGIANLVLLI